MDEVLTTITATALAITLWITGSLGKALHFGYALSHWLGTFLPA
jgi:hypothetical protein